MNMEGCVGKQGRRESGRCVGMDKHKTTLDIDDWLQRG